uniref:Small ribosomal subunit protein eS8 n=1 Tax=Staphylothermus marinus TaxID=2280 RepID=A0A7C4NN42_STAMA
MSYYQGADLKKPSGGKKRRFRDKRKFELGSPPTNTKLDVVEERIVDRVRGGNLKVRLKKVSHIVVSIPGEGRSVKTRILEVIETPDNPQNARFNLITKGTIVRTELGLVKVTSRPGQCGTLCGVLIKK